MTEGRFYHDREVPGGSSCPEDGETGRPERNHVFLFMPFSPGPPAISPLNTPSVFIIIYHILASNVILEVKLMGRSQLSWWENGRDLWVLP